MESFGKCRSASSKMSEGPSSLRCERVEFGTPSQPDSEDFQPCTVVNFGPGIDDKFLLQIPAPLSILEQMVEGSPQSTATEAKRSASHDFQRQQWGYR